MIVLGIETATPHGGAALWQDGRTIASAENDGAISHSQRLMPSIDLILKETGLTLRDLDGIAVSIGPGSFTGLRIGLSVAKTLAHAAQKPIVPVGTLEALAECFARPDVLLVPMLDARRSEVFGALFRKIEGEDRLRRLSADVVEAPAVFAARIGEFCIAGGSGAERYAEFLATQLGDRVELVQGEGNRPSASVVAAIGARELIAGRSANVLTLEPVYVRKSDAELSVAHRAIKRQ